MPEAREPVAALDEDEIEQYVSGKCMYLAAAVHRVTGWEIQAAVEPAADGYPRYVGHAWCVNPQTGDCVDIDGAYPVQANGWLRPDNILQRAMTEQALFHLVAEGSPRLSRLNWDAEVQNALSVVQSYLLPRLFDTPA